MSPYFEERAESGNHSSDQSENCYTLRAAYSSKFDHCCNLFQQDLRHHVKLHVVAMFLNLSSNHLMNNLLCQ